MTASSNKPAAPGKKESPAVRLNEIIKRLKAVQGDVDDLAEELNSELLEEVDGEIDMAMSLIADCLEENGWKVK